MTQSEVDEARAAVAIAALREEVARLKATIDRFCLAAEELRALVARGEHI